MPGWGFGKNKLTTTKQNHPTLRFGDVKNATIIKSEPREPPRAVLCGAQAGDHERGQRLGELGAQVGGAATVAG